MSFICEPHSEMWAVDTGCPYCRERKLEQKLVETRVDKLLTQKTLEAEVAKLKEAIKTHKGSFIGDDKQGDIVPEDDRLWAVLEVEK